MTADFALMNEHLDAPRSPASRGKVVLSSLGPGSTLIGARAPSVKLVLEGEEVYRIDGRTIRVGPGQFLYLEAGSDCVGTNRTDTVGLCLMLPVSDDPDPAPIDPLLGRALALSTRTSRLGQHLDNCARRIHRDPELGPRLAGSIVRQVGIALAEPLSASREAIERVKAARPATRRELYQRLETARSHLHDHLDRSVALAELATVAGLSQFHLARYFKAAFGTAPAAYHRALRLERAAGLVEGGASLAAAAEAAGYSDQTALSHAFRKHFGRAPLQWAMRRTG